MEIQPSTATQFFGRDQSPRVDLDNVRPCAVTGVPVVRMSPPEIGLAVLLVLWTLGSVLFVLPIRRVQRWLGSINHFRFFVTWGVFSNRDRLRRAGTFELVVREVDLVGGVSRWRTVASGYSWSWRSFCWWPQRYPAAAIQNLGRQIKRSLTQAPPGWQPAMSRARVLGDYAARVDPETSAKSTEFSLLRRFPGGGAPDEVVLVFSRPPDSHGH